MNDNVIKEIPILIEGAKYMVEFPTPISFPEDFQIKLMNTTVIETEEVKEDEVIINTIPKEIELEFLVMNPKTGKIKKKWFYGKVKKELKGE